MRAVCLQLKHDKYGGFSETFHFDKFDAKNAILNDANKGIYLDLYRLIK